MKTIPLECAPSVNYSLVESGLAPVIRRVVVPAGQTAVAAVRRFTPEGRELHLPEGESVGLSPELDPMLLAGLSRPLRTELVVSLENGRQAVHPTTVLPLCAWDQRRAYAEATAVFVLENDPFVLRVVRRAGISPAQGSAPAVRPAARRLYEHLHASYELCYLYERGLLEPEQQQLVRFPFQMYWECAGTCIDLVLLCSAACYRAGLDPVVVLLGDELGSRHALVGLWTEPSAARETVVSPDSLQSAVERGKLVVWEATGLTQDTPSFEEAEALGRSHFRSMPPLWGVDVSEARRRGTASLPERAATIVLAGLPEQVTDLFTRTRTAEAADFLGGLEVRVSSPGGATAVELAGRDYRAVRIGRGPNNHVVLTHGSISREHAVIFVKERRVYIKDLGSRAGTLVGESPLEPFAPQPLPTGASLRLGEVELEVCYEENADGAAARG